MGERCPVADGKLLTLKEMTVASGRTPRTVRYYERRGLLRARRSAGGHRLFPPDELDRLDFIVRLREAGGSLDEISALLSVRGGGAPDGQQVEHLTRLISAQIDRLEARLERLGRLRDELCATRELLPVCCGCARGRARVTCDGCERLPDDPGVPSAFRITWRGAGGPGGRSDGEGGA